MSDRTVLDETSLAHTLWNLEEARLRGEKAGSAEVCGALDWVVSRYRAPGAYRDILFAPAAADIERREATPTGEDGSLGRAGLAHMLGEEAARALLLWGRTEGWDSAGTVRTIAQTFRASAVGTGQELPGRFCCTRCSIARWRAVSAGTPDGYEEILADALRMLREDAVPGGGWRRYPFYYTLLALADMPLPEAASEVTRLRACTERRMLRLKGDDQATRFRRLAAQWALSR